MKHLARTVLPVLLGLAMTLPAAGEEFKRAEVARSAHQLSDAATAFHRAIRRLEGFSDLAGRVSKLSQAAEHFHQAVERGSSHGHAYRDFLMLRQSLLSIRVLFHRTLQVPADDANDGWYYKALYSYTGMLTSYRQLKGLMLPPQPTARLVVSGRVAGQRFQVTGSSRREIAAKLARFYDENLASNHWIDRIVVRVNDGKPQRIYNEYSYWTTRDEVVGVILKYVPRVRMRPRPRPRPTIWRYPAENLRHATGRKNGQGWAGIEGQDRAGWLLYGPYATDITPGRRSATFTAMVNVIGGRNDRVMTIDVNDSVTGAVLARRHLHRRDWDRAGRYKEFTLPFDAQRGQKLEFRIYWTGVGSVRVEKIVVR